MGSKDIFSNYEIPEGVFDEMFSKRGSVREQYSKIYNILNKMDLETLNKKEELTRRLFMSLGITFTVYSNNEGIEKIFPFDIIPRIIQAKEWEMLDKGIKQRLKALNLFLQDIYSEQTFSEESNKKFERRNNSARPINNPPNSLHGAY